MTIVLTPLRIIAFTVAVNVALVVGTLWLATSQPWLGITLSADVNSGEVRIVAVDPKGPAAQVPTNRGRVLIEGVALEPNDLVEEPDTLRSYADFIRLLDRGGRFLSILGRDSVLVTSGAGAETDDRVHPRATRPLSALPLTFWSQILAGTFALLIGVWVWSLRQRDVSAGLLALAGGFLLTMIFPAAVYSTREISLDPRLFRYLAALDHLGALGYGVAMVTLFYTYPRRIASTPLLYALPTIAIIWWILDAGMMLFESSALGFYLPSLLLMILFLPAALLQYRLTRSEPAMRASLRWFALSVGIGSGAFVVLFVLPNLMSRQSPIAQAHAFLLFSIVFGGIAVGVARYRLFDLEIWAFRILFYIAGVALVLATDAFFVYFIAVDQIPAFGTSIVVIALLYLPLRDSLWRRLTQVQIPRDSLFPRVVEIALSPPGIDRNDRWRSLMQNVFDPLQIEGGAWTRDVTILREGVVLLLPAVDDVSSLRLGYACGGSKLFTRADQALAAELCSMLQHASRSRQAREEGVADERTRIARDIHDNVGAKLLSALHSDRSHHKDAMIRDVLSSIRDIVNDMIGQSQGLEGMLAELRVETADRLEDAGIALEWQACAACGIGMTPSNVYMLRSVINEAITNVIRHARATKVAVKSSEKDGCFALTISDDGRGLGDAKHQGGNGLGNIRTRVRALEGTFTLKSTCPGTSLMIELPGLRDGAS